MNTQSIHGMCILIVFMLVTSVGYTQTYNGCRDTLMIKYGVPCKPDYEPVCGCNNKTYRNYCFATNDGVNPQLINQGICEGIDMDFNPNPALDYLYLNIAVKAYAEIQFFIFDRFGKRYFQVSYLPSFTTNIYSGTLDINTLPLGVYILVAQSNGNIVRKKMIKVTN